MDAYKSRWARRSAYRYDFEYLSFEHVEWEDFYGIRNAAMKLKLRDSSIKKVLDKRIKYTGGYTFEYINKKEIWVKKKNTHNVLI